MLYLYIIMLNKYKILLEVYFQIFENLIILYQRRQSAENFIVFKL